MWNAFRWLLPFVLLALSAPAQAGRLQLIVHRGGVVDEVRPENSLPALDEAIRRGFSHAEVDLRVTRDGHVVCLHDRNLKRTAGLDLNIDEVTLDQLYAKVDPGLVPTLEAYAARAEGRIGLMPDIKGAPQELAAAYKAGVRDALERHGLMRGALFIGDRDIGLEFAGPARVAWRKPYADFRREVASTPGQAARYFAFNHAKDFDAAQVAGFHGLGVEVVVTVNTLHYAAGDPIAQGAADVARAQALGVDGLQIDAVYAPFVKTDRR